MVPKGCANIVLSSLLFIFSASYSVNGKSYNRHKRQSESNGCTLPPHPEHGRWQLLNGQASPGDKVLEASVITFECRPGYKLSSKIPLVCLGDWSSQAPQCEELCPPLYPSNAYELKCTDKIGRDVNCTEATHGTSLEYSCKDFYETPFGFKKALLCENGKWDNSRPMCQPVCGRKISNDTKTLIYGSKADENIIYPWIAAVYQKINGSYENICGGSILSQTVILTAAHCVTNDYGNVLPKENYMVGVGKLYRIYQAPKDSHAQYLELSKIIVPEEYKADIRKYAGDIAVLVVKKEIHLNKVIQPICFTNMKNIHLHAGNKGEVSGWGLAEGDMPSEVLRTLVIPYKHETVCADELPPEWADRYNLKDKICAGFVNKSTSVCSGDSGGGLVFNNRDNNRYYIHGIVSVSHQVGYMCNIQQNALYTSVASHYEFVDRLMTRYAPKVKDCVLPNYPQNGKWTSKQRNLKPGDLAASNTMLKVECDDGFKLSSSGNIECSEAQNMPTCEMLCPKPEFPRGTDFQCSNREEETIDCSRAVDGSTLRYSCSGKYRAADDLDNRICIKGSWGFPKPECILECGKKVVDSSGVGAEYPWNVGIYKLNNNAEEKKREEENYKNICGGSLVSQYVVVTAAQCVTDELYNLQSKDDYLIGAGKLYATINDPRDSHVQFSNLTYINVHPEYKLSRGAVQNVALLIASRPFSFNNFVQPLCLDQYNDLSFNIDNFETTTKMIGWIFTQGISSKMVDAVEVNHPANYKTVRDQVPYQIKQAENKSTCLQPEDRGKSIIVKHTGNERYYLLGVVLYFEVAACKRLFWSLDITIFSAYIESTAYYL